MVHHLPLGKSIVMRVSHSFLDGTKATCELCTVNRSQVSACPDFFDNTLRRFPYAVIAKPFGAWAIFHWSLPKIIEGFGGRPRDIGDGLGVQAEGRLHLVVAARHSVDFVHHYSPSSSGEVPAGPQWPACRRPGGPERRRGQQGYYERLATITGSRRSRGHSHIWPCRARTLNASLAQSMPTVRSYGG